MNIKELKKTARDQLKERKWLIIITTLVANLIISISSVLDLVAEDTYISLLIGCVSIITLLLSGVIACGQAKFFLNIIEDYRIGSKNARFKDIFSQFNIFFKTLGLYFAIFLIELLITIVGGIITAILMVFIEMNLVVGILGAIAFIVIPVIYMQLLLSQVYYVLAEDNSKTIRECLKESRILMEGNILKYILINLSFIGWYLILAIMLVIVFVLTVDSIVLTIVCCGFALMIAVFVLIWVVPYQMLTMANFYKDLTTDLTHNIDEIV